jgi:putative hydrolase of the HAD superfamily
VAVGRGSISVLFGRVNPHHMTRFSAAKYPVGRSDLRPGSSARLHRAMIKAVLFDFGGVFTQSPFVAVNEAAAELGLDPDEALDVIFGSYGEDTDHPWHRVERGELSLMDYRTETQVVLAERGIDLDPFEVLKRLGSGGSDGGTIRVEMVELVRRVKASDRQTGIITNNALELRDLWRPLLPIDEIFDTVVDSCEVGVRKPDPRIFEMALDRLDVAPEQAAFLDDYEGNVKAAQALGMTGVLVAPDHEPAMTELVNLLEL